MLFRSCLHVPTAPGHGLLSIPCLLELNYSIMLAGCSPCLILDHKEHLEKPNFPKYFPFTHVKGQFFFKGIFITPSTPALPLIPPVLLALPFAPMLLPTASHLVTLLSSTIPQPIAMVSIPSFVSLALSLLPQLPVPLQTPILHLQPPPLPP